MLVKIQNNSILPPTSSSSATPGTRFLVRATRFVRQTSQAQQKRMESCGDVAQSAGVAADDAGSGGTAIDIDQMTREALLNLLTPYSSGASSSEVHEPGSIAACRDAWQAAGQLPPRETAMAIAASHKVWPEGVPQGVMDAEAWVAAESAIAQETEHAATAQQQVCNCDPPLAPMPNPIVTCLPRAPPP